MRRLEGAARNDMDQPLQLPVEISAYEIFNEQKMTYTVVSSPSILQVPCVLKTKVQVRQPFYILTNKSNNVNLEKYFKHFIA